MDCKSDVQTVFLCSYLLYLVIFIIHENGRMLFFGVKGKDWSILVHGNVPSVTDSSLTPIYQPARDLKLRLQNVKALTSFGSG